MPQGWGDCGRQMDFAILMSGEGSLDHGISCLTLSYPKRQSIMELLASGLHLIRCCR